MNLNMLNNLQGIQTCTSMYECPFWESCKVGHEGKPTNKIERYLRNAKLRKEQEKSLGGCNINLCDQLCLRRGLDIFQVLDGGKIIRQKGGGKSIFCSYYLLHTPHIQPYLKVLQIVKLTNISHLFFSTFLLKIYTSYLKKLLQ